MWHFRPIGSPVFLPMLCVLYTCCIRVATCVLLCLDFSLNVTLVYTSQSDSTRGWRNRSIDRFFDSTNYTSMLLRSLRHISRSFRDIISRIYIEISHVIEHVLSSLHRKKKLTTKAIQIGTVAIRELSRAWCKRDEASIRRKTVTRVNGETVYLKAAWNRYDVKQKSLLLPYPAVICHEFFIVIRSR